MTSKKARQKSLLKTGSAVYIEWEDSYGCSSNWQNINPDGQPELMICRSIGWIIKVSARAVVIVPHIAQNERLEANQACGDMVIPLAAIVLVKPLKGIQRMYLTD